MQIKQNVSALLILLTYIFRYLLYLSADLLAIGDPESSHKSSQVLHHQSSIHSNKLKQRRMHFCELISHFGIGGRERVEISVLVDHPNVH